MSFSDIDPAHSAMFGYAEGADHKSVPHTRPKTSYGNRRGSTGVTLRNGRVVKNGQPSRLTPGPPKGGLSAKRRPSGLPIQQRPSVSEKGEHYEVLEMEGEEENGDYPRDTRRGSTSVNRFFAPQPDRAESNTAEEMEGSARYDPLDVFSGPRSEEPSALHPPSHPAPKTALDFNAILKLYAIQGGTADGVRLLKWARISGVPIAPNHTLLKAVVGFMSNPVRFASAYRRACIMGRHCMDKLADPSVIGAALRSCDISYASTPKHSLPANSPGKEGGFEDESDVAVGDSTLLLSLHNGLQSLRQQREYQLWCSWQIQHFYEQGASYLKRVWRHVPNGNSSMTPEDLCGQYVLPCHEKIEALIGHYKHERRRISFFANLLLKEFSLSEGDVSPFGKKVSLFNVDEESFAVDQDESIDGGTDDINASRRASRLASTQPLLDVTFDVNTGRLHISIYINGEGDNGEGAEFFGSSVACCLDNFRWLVVEGKWSGKILFFVPRYSPIAGSPRLCGIDSLIVGQIPWKKLVVKRSRSEFMVCAHCGNIVRKSTKRMVSQHANNATNKTPFCVLCRKKRKHVSAPMNYPLARTAFQEAVSSLLARCAVATPASSDGPSVQEVKEKLSAAYGNALHILLSEDPNQKPRWKPCKKINWDRLCGRGRSLHAVPPKPKIDTAGLFSTLAKVK